MTKPICIVMATYNGAPYVEGQIASIQAQSLKHWRLLVRDDGSTDDTLDIVNRLASADTRIKLIDKPLSSNLGPSQNFSAALEAALRTESDLFFIADQDDVWEPNKLLLQSAQFPMTGAEELPLLVHSDLAVVDEFLNPIHSSLISYMALTPSPVKPLEYLLTRNFVTGCATACNRRLLEAALPVSEHAIMHDWWLALVATATGQIKYVDKPLVNYRQHRANSIGAKGFWHGLNPTRNWIAGWQAGNAEYLATFKQIAELDRHVAQCADWPQGNLTILQRYLALGSIPLIDRVSEANKLGIRQGNGLLQLIFYIRLLTVHHKMPCGPP